jgi:NADPH-dependent ferric siderophore reductase
MTVPAESAVAQPFRMFQVRVARVRRLSPSFVRLTFTGRDLDEMADNGYDQRIKLILPLPGRGLDPLPTGDDWYAAWRRLPEALRNPVRTYTIRRVRPFAREVDVDMVLHGVDGGEPRGPAAQFASQARPGDEAVLLGPDAAYRGRHGGLEFRPQSSSSPLLLAADETGVPAVANIVQALPPDAVGHVLLEVPHPDDRFDLGAPAGVHVSWSARGRATHGSHLLTMVHTTNLPGRVRTSDTAPALAAPGALAAPASPGAPTARAAARAAQFDNQSDRGQPGRSQADGAEGAEDADGTEEGEVLWDVPEGPPRPDPSHDRSSAPDIPPYAWVAGEASTVRAIRRHLVNDLGWDRRTVAFMGYWRLGRAEC